MRKIWIRKFTSFEDAAQAELLDYFNMSPKERIETMQLLRHLAGKIKRNLRLGKGRKRLRRVIKVIQQKENRFKWKLKI